MTTEPAWDDWFAAQYELTKRIDKAIAGVRGNPMSEMHVAVISGGRGGEFCGECGLHWTDEVHVTSSALPDAGAIADPASGSVGAGEDGTVTP